MNLKTKNIISFIGFIIIVLIIYWLLESLQKTNEGFNALSVTDQPDPNTPAPNGMFPWSIENQRQGRTVVENDLRPDTNVTYTDFEINPQAPPWRPPVHPLVVPATGEGGTGIATYMGLVNIDLPWMSPVFQEFKEKDVKDWVKATSDELSWGGGVERWNWKPYPDDKQVIQQWHNLMWRDAKWRPPVQETRDNQAPAEPTIPNAYWKRWAIEWLNRWNEEEVRTLNSMPKDIRSRTLDYPFQYGRLWYVQGWDAEVNNGKKVRIIQYFGELVRPFAQIVYLMDWILVGDPTKPNQRPNISVAWIGTRTYDDVWMPEGLASNAITAQSTSPDVPPPQLLPWQDVEGELRRKQFDAGLMRGNMQLAFQCFIPGPIDGKLKSHLLFASSKEDCENRLDNFGREKPQGVWDHPCITDQDCLFHGSNKNYPNNFGRCLENGRCQWPLGMEPLGYRYFIPDAESEPYCYNCESDTWLPNTEIGKCCEAQRDRKKYPHLKGPDFVFRGDQPQRERHYTMTKCKTNDNDTKIMFAKERDLHCQDFPKSFLQLYPKQIKEQKLELVPIPDAVEGVSNDMFNISSVPGQTNATFVPVTPQNANR